MNNVIVIMGPTASGKTGLALRLAERSNAVIINADSMQVYQDIPILSAQPSNHEKNVCDHKLYGFMAADQICSAGKYVESAKVIIEQAIESNMLPIIVGGTGLYIHSLIYGISAIPDIDMAIRERVRGMYSEMGAEKFYQILSVKDPQSAAKLNVNDQQRVIRAYEVIEQTGKSIIEWQQHKVSPMPNVSFKQILLNPERNYLYSICNSRFNNMLRAGAIEEVQRLNALTEDYKLPVRRAIGVKEISSYLYNELSLEEAVTLAQTATRQYAKRQLTWFRHQAKDANIINYNHIDEVYKLSLL